MTPQAEVLRQPKSAKVTTVEFWRFAFTVLVCLYHLEIFFPKRNLLVSGTSAVEFFFVLAGFLIAMSAKRDLAGRTDPVTTREAHAKAVDYVWKKLKAIFPVLIVVLLLGILVYPMKPAPFLSRLSALQNTEWELLMLVGTPFGFNNGAAPVIPLWFLTGLIIVGYLYTFAVYKKYDFMMFAAPAIGVLFYIYFALNSTKIIDHEVPMGFFTAGTVRAISEMGLGIAVFGLYDVLSKKNFGRIWRLVLSVFELYAIYRFFDLTFGHPLEMDNFRRIVYVLIIVLLSFLNVTAFTRVMNRRFWRRLGGISLTMYLCHYNLIFLYLQLLRTAKMRLGAASGSSPFAGAVYSFLQGTGGFDDKFRQIPMTWKDALLFMLLVLLVTVLITLFVAAVGRFVVRPCLARYKAKQVAQETASVAE